MKLEDIKKVKMATTEKDVNEALKEGYRIIKILSTKICTAQAEQIQATFIMGCIYQE